jgi:endonuclease/exonuclease/phosphatase (EEP) superfamily protein YafD
MEQKIIENNFEKRSFQADSISRLVEASTLPVIVCGDFNDTPASYAYHRLKGNLTDSFRSCGYGYAYTYRYMHKLFRIDYVFYPSEMFVGDKYESPDVAFSDHNPVIVGLGFKN